MLDIQVKRERAASPSLSAALTKKRKTTQARAGLSSGSGAVTNGFASVRHTRGHDDNPDSACSTCILSGKSLPRHSFGLPHSPRTALLAKDLASSAQPASTTRPALKSALRVSSASAMDPGSSSSGPRRVRFTQDLYDEASAAYIHATNSVDRSGDGFVIDIPPRTRTPPNSGPNAGSKPGTPQPAKPPRPASDTDADAALADVPPRLRTPLGGNAPGSQQNIPHPARLVRRCSDAIIVTPRTRPILLARDDGLGSFATRANEYGQEIPLSLPIPPRARTPPGPPGGGSRPCTPEPCRPVRPAGDAQADGVVQVISNVIDGYGGPAKAVSLSTTELSANTRADVQNVKKSKISRASLAAANAIANPGFSSCSVKVEQEEHVVPWKTGEVLVLGDDEDDGEFARLRSSAIIDFRGLTCINALRAEPLVVVLARRRAGPAVKAEPVEVVVTRNERIKKRSTQKASAKAPAKNKGKGKQSAVVAVKQEVSSLHLEETGQAAPPKKKRATRAKGAKQLKTEDPPEVKLEADVAPSTMTKRKTTSKKPGKTKDTSTNAAKAAVQTTEKGAATGSKKTTKKAKTVSKRDAASHKSSDGNDPVHDEPPWSTTLTLRVSITRAPSLTLPRKASFHGPIHPPRTWTYLPAHLEALGSVMWDVEGFERMELSAIPWIAAVGQHSNAPRELMPACEQGKYDTCGTVVFGFCFLVVADDPLALCVGPVVPCRDPAGELEENVCMRLYADGPLPTSFLRALGRTVSVRRDGDSGVGQVDFPVATEGTESEKR
ncbi:hypothetical protein BN946_scf184706.g4 [Trametes cinnabarina]|uniref:Uncharacterized protein n=1 Tax=Pycnoporus cinnabarinus TaxID=5643 RepID=A0A060SKM5_PYCCI|nr:hypothetical protein BN946_scf184706.g4 [Trametes cinnabarina]